jgi:hypothetical protein
MIRGSQKESFLGRAGRQVGKAGAKTFAFLLS